MDLLIISHSAAIGNKLFPGKTCMRINTNHIMTNVDILLAIHGPTSGWAFVVEVVLTIIMETKGLREFHSPTMSQVSPLALCAR